MYQSRNFRSFADSEERKNKLSIFHNFLTTEEQWNLIKRIRMKFKMLKMKVKHNNERTGSQLRHLSSEL